MRICEVIGVVTLSRPHPSIRGARLLIARPTTTGDLREGRRPSGEPIVIYDELGASVGSTVGVSEGREGAMPFWPERKPVDAYCSVIVERLGLSQKP